MPDNNKVTFSTRLWSDEVAATEPVEERIPVYIWSNGRIWWDVPDPYANAPVFDPK